MTIVESNDHAFKSHVVNLDEMPVFGLSAVIDGSRAEVVEEPEVLTVDELVGQIAVHEALVGSSDS